MKYKILLAVFLLTVLSMVSCRKKQELTVRAVTRDELGKEAVCPVTQSAFKITEDIKALEYMGKTYYFCCPGCDIDFIKDPEKYIPQSLNRSIAQSPNSSILYWTCSMHPRVRADNPGKCPVCAMGLIPVYKGEEDKIIVDEKKARLLGLKSEPVKIMPLTKTVRLPAKVAYDNDLYLAQQEYLSGFRNLKKIGDLDTGQKNRVADTLESAKFRLLLLGYSEDNIRELERLAQPDKNLIYPGENIWLHADVFEYDLGVVKPGQTAVATVAAYPLEKFTGIVRFIESVLEPQTRSATARVEFKNPEGKLKLEMYAELEIKIQLGRELVVQESAFIDTGTRKIVYLDLGQGRYKMQEIKTGFETEDYVQILSGLKEGDVVVTDGNFMLDSQSTLTGGQALLYGAAEEVETQKKPTPTTNIKHRH